MERTAASVDLCEAHRFRVSSGAVGGDNPHGAMAEGAVLDVVCDESDVRLGCLELYINLTRLTNGPVTGGSETAGITAASQDAWHNNLWGSPGGKFEVKADEDQRVLLSWQCGVRGRWAHDKDAVFCRNREGSGNCFRSPRDQSWRVSCAFAPEEPADALWNTLGLEAVEWLWGGHSALVLAVGLRTPTTPLAVTPLCADGINSNGEVDTGNGVARAGLLGFCLEELCRRVSIHADTSRFCLGLSVWEMEGCYSEDLLAAYGEDASSELRFETARFQSLSEALLILKAAGLFRAGEADAQDSNDTTGGQNACRRHVCVRVVLFDAIHETLAALHFIQIAGNLDDDGSSGAAVADRQALWSMLEAASKEEEVVPARQCRLSEVLAPLLSGNCKPFLLCSVPEKPSCLTSCAEVHGLLDLAERASLITVHCVRVRGVCQEDFQLAETELVLNRLQQCHSERQSSFSHKPQVKGAGASCRESPRTPQGCNNGGRLQRQIHSASSVAATTHTLCGQVSCGQAEDGRVHHEEQTAVDVASDGEVVYDAEPSPRQRSPSRPPHLPSSNNVSVPRSQSRGEASATCPEACPKSWDVDEDYKHDVGTVPKDGSRTNQMHHLEQRLRLPLSGDAAKTAEECRELAAACAALRARNHAKSAKRAQELEAVRAEVSLLQEALVKIEDDCDAPAILDGFRLEIKAFRGKAERLKRENAAIAGARELAVKHELQQMTLKQLRADAAQLRRSTADVDQNDKRANLVHRCLEEVRSRLDAARHHQLIVDSELAEMQPAYSRLQMEIEATENRRRYMQGELEKLRRTSAGMRAEIDQLKEVRDAVENLPSTTNEVPVDCSPGTGAERFAALQRKLVVAAPNLLPLCNRAQSEMEDLIQCCKRLEERQRRLQQVAPLEAEGACGTFGVASRTSSAAHSLSRARSTGAISRPSQSRGYPTVPNCAGASALHHGSTTPRITASTPASGASVARNAIGRDGCGSRASSCSRNWNQGAREPSVAGQPAPPRGGNGSSDRVASAGTHSDRGELARRAKQQNCSSYAQAWTRARPQVTQQDDNGVMEQRRLPPKAQVLEARCSRS